MSDSLKEKFEVIRKCFYRAGYYTIHHDGIEHAGYLAFLGMLSFFPFLVFFIAIAALIGEVKLGEEFLNVVIEKLPEDMIGALKPRIVEIIEGPPQGLLTIAIIGAIWTASSAVEGLRTVLNRAYRVKTPPSYLWRRMLSIAQFLALTAIIIVAMSLIIFVPPFWHQIERITGLVVVLEPIINNFGYLISSFIIFLVIAISYYVLPNIKQNRRAVVPGALVTLILWVGAAELLSGYIENFEQVNIVYGSLGGIIVALLFFYVISVIYIFGAEFNYFYESAMGVKFVEKEKVTAKKSGPKKISLKKKKRKK